MTTEHNEVGERERLLGVAVITPVGTFPNEDDLRKAHPDEKIKAIIEKADEKFGLTNTDGWVATVHDREIDINKTFEEERLACVVEIEWHKPEGGGGSRRTRATKI